MNSKAGEYMNGIREVKHGNSGLHPTTVGNCGYPKGTRKIQGKQE
jgi:hypothetical protein